MNDRKEIAWTWRSAGIGRLAADELGTKHHLLMLMRAIRRNLVHEQLRGRISQIVLGLSYRGERRWEHRSQINVIIANEGDITGDLNLFAREGVHDTESQIIVATKDSRRTIPQM